MTCCKSLLTISYFCLFYPSFTLSKATNDTSKNVQGSYANIPKSTESNFTIQSQKEILNQSFEECNCGIHSIACRLDNYGKKKCTCEYGYTALLSHKTFEEECTKCFCGSGEMLCKAGKNGQKKCTCKKGYAPKIDIPSFEEYCEVCDCGKGEESCKYDGIGLKKCFCRKGYAVKLHEYINEQCEKCDCGIDELTCELDYIGWRKCTCGGDSFAVSGLGGQTCEKCSCGPNSLSCQKVYGSKTCICKIGYVARVNSWNSDEECVNARMPDRDLPTFPWKVLTYIVIAVYGLIIVSMLVTIFLKNANMKPY